MINKKIRVVSPSSPCDLKKIFKSKEIMENMGFEVELARNFGAKNKYLAGKDEERFSDLKDALEDETVNIIWMSRGGYGSVRLLQDLKDINPSTQKTLIGYSDATALFCWALKKKKIKTIYGPSFSELSNENSYNKKNLFNAVFEKPYKIRCEGPSKSLKEIKIVGGCFSIVVSLMGTPFFLDVNDKWLLLEDINEPMYKIDRMIMQLKLGGIFEKIKGVILGSFKNIDGGDYKSVVSVVQGCLGARKPLLVNKRIGHSPRKISLPLNISAEWNGKELCFF